MKKIKLLIIAIIIVTISIIFGCINYHSQYQTKTISNFFNNDPSKITRIDIVNSSGSVITVDDKKLISNISSYFSKMKFNKVYNEPSTGWLYQFLFYDNSSDEFVFTFLSYHNCQINNSKYEITTKEDTIESLYNEIKKVSK